MEQNSGATHLAPWHSVGLLSVRARFLSNFSAHDNHGGKVIDRWGLLVPTCKRDERPFGRANFAITLLLVRTMCLGTSVLQTASFVIAAVPTASAEPATVLAVEPERQRAADEIAISLSRLTFVSEQARREISLPSRAAAASPAPEFIDPTLARPVHLHFMDVALMEPDVSPSFADLGTPETVVRSTMILAETMAVAQLPSPETMQVKPLRPQKSKRASMSPAEAVAQGEEDGERSARTKPAIQPMALGVKPRASVTPPDKITKDVSIGMSAWSPFNRVEGGR
jgi:hypothetical protein